MSTLDHLAVARMWADDLVEAQLLAMSLVEARSRTLGPDHPETQQARELLATINERLP